MSCGYACVGCGKCTGTPKPMLETGTCPACGYQNTSDAIRCVECGRPLPPRPGMATAKPVGAEDGDGSGSRQLL